jgi:hypothetical protein
VQDRLGARRGAGAHDCGPIGGIAKGRREQCWGLGPTKHWPRTLADQFPGRWLLALGRWIMAVKIDTPPHVAIAAGVAEKPSFS